MSSSNSVASEKLCHIPCNFCRFVLAVAVPCSNLFGIMTVRCGHCNNISSLDIEAALRQMSTKHTQVPSCSSLRYHDSGGSSSRCKNKLARATTPVNPTRERVVNQPPAKRQRAPSLYNQFIKEEIQRIKVKNPEISHREAFSTAAKNWARFPRVNSGLTLESSSQAKLADVPGEHFVRLHT